MARSSSRAPRLSSRTATVAIACFVAIMSLATPSPATAQAPTPIDLGHLGGGSATATAAADGYVVGSSLTTISDGYGGYVTHAFVWRASTQTMTDLGALIPDSGYSVATSVNSRGEVVGISYGPDGTKAFYWSATNGLRIIADTVGNRDQNQVLINENGLVAGRDANGQLFRWTVSGGLTDAGLPGDPGYTAVTGLNSAGDIVGNTWTQATGNQGFGVVGFVAPASSNAITILTSQGRPNGPPFCYQNEGEYNLRISGINDLGVVVGTYWDFQCRYYINGGFGGTDAVHNQYAFKWTQASGYTDLGRLGSWLSAEFNYTLFASGATAINNSGVIIGASSPGTRGFFPTQAFSYQGNGPMTALPTPANPYYGSSATSINNDGVIAGQADGQMILWTNGVMQVISAPSFARNYPSLTVSQHMVFGNSYGQETVPPYGFPASHAWAFALPSAPAAQLFFTDPLTGPNSPNLAAIPARKYGYTGSGLKRTQSNSTTDRPMVTTALSSYLGSTTGDFGAEVTVRLTSPDLLFFGLGQGDMDSSYFNEPNHAFYFRVHSNWQGNSSIQGDVRAGNFLAIKDESVFGYYSPGSTITLRITRIGDNVTMSVVGGASFTYSLSAYQAALGLTGSNTRVFFGNTSAGSIFSNLRIYKIDSDTTAPSITAPADIVAEATSAAGATVSFTASATDGVDGAVPVTATPASGATFPIGNTVVALSAHDAAGNTASASFNVKVQDTIAPAVSVPANITAEATSASGAAVTYTVPAATDAVGVTSQVSNPPSGSTFPLGNTIVTVTAKDAAGNVGSASFTVMVKDTIAPALTVPANLTLEATSAAGAVANFSATATDAVTAVPTITYSQPSGTTFPIGTTTVTVKARDAAGNESTGSFTITVRDTTAPALASVTTSTGSCGRQTTRWSRSR